MSEDTQIKAEFKPTPLMIEFADQYIIHQSNMSKACAALGDPHRNIYYNKISGFKHIEGFDQWLSDYAQKQVMSRVGKWYLIAEKYAEAGSYKHLEMLFGLAEKYIPTSKVILEEHPVEKASDEELDEMINGFEHRSRAGSRRSSLN